MVKVSFALGDHAEETSQYIRIANMGLLQETLCSFNIRTLYISLIHVFNFQKIVAGLFVDF